MKRFPLKTNMARAIFRKYSEGNQGSPSSTNVPPASSQPSVPNVPGLSSACIAPASQPVGPGVEPNKSGAYKVPEYFQYNNMSYFEAEIEMLKYRCPQPSALKK
ncbi:hypothetical protein JYU34_013401 [Plutella xylostella]|uniref:NADH dehydrogenase [ubiquinone] flavoprotein 3, mitochondrial n=1 Tax=Plutella xylostella TaxID=51655 RepID=A0ABQ7Q9P8_PLUXY|nr:uncharacterized protein LOC105380772 [Plutella xylostella]KAG7301957.1 hypothetical protein JYU34_013401 [Plutella xylostella]